MNDELYCSTLPERDSLMDVNLVASVRRPLLPRTADNPSCPKRIAQTQ
jgi:hypothetical protein